MESPSGRRWLIAAVALFLLLLTGWVLLALQLSVAQAGLLPFAPGLASRLSSDYGPDQGGRPIAVVSLSILEDAMQALGLSDEEAEAAHDSMERAMSQPVPTATALNFEGAAPFTATPTVSNTPLPTSTPTATSTNTPRPPPTKTPKPSKTPKPTNPPATAGPTAVASPTGAGVDTVNPTVMASAGDFNPSPPDNLGACTIDVDDVQVVDPAFSSGISQVYAKVEVDDGSTVQTYLFLLSKDSGGFVAGPGSTFDAEYDGTIDLTGKVLTGDIVTVYIKAKDVANGVWQYSSPFTYNWGRDC